MLLSGGVDSVLLLYLFLRNFSPSDILVLHLNYQLRQESSLDEKFVRKLCDSYRVELIVKVVDLKSKSNLQAEARCIRYEIAKKMMKQYSIPYLLTGHHCDDGLENFLLKQIKGQSVGAMKNIFEVKNNDHLRPLMPFLKSDLIHYADQNKIKFVEDKTNRESYYERNFIRNQIFPKFDGKFFHWKKNLLRYHKSIITQNDLLLKLVEKSHIVLEKAPYFLLTPHFFFLELPQRLWLFHFYLTRHFPEIRFTHSAIKNYLNKIGLGRKGVVLFESAKYGKIYYSYHLVGSIPSLNFSVGATFNSNNLSRLGLTLSTDLPNHGSFVKISSAISLRKDVSEENSILHFNLIEVRKETFIDSRKGEKRKKLLKDILSDNRIPLHGRKWLWRVDEGEKTIGFLSSLFYLQPLYSKAKLKTNFYSSLLNSDTTYHQKNYYLILQKRNERKTSY